MARKYFSGVLWLFASLGATAETTPVIESQMDRNSPLVIAHRGASGYLPEHTLEAALLAFQQGADFIEQDIVMTQDRQLVVLHDIHIDTTTNVAKAYPNRARSDGRFYAIDFTLSELKSLDVHERTDKDGNPVYPNRYNGQARFKIATFNEHIELIQLLNQLNQTDVGLYPEIKAPAWHRQQGYDISKAVLSVLRHYQLDDATKAIYVQCFDFEETKRLRNDLNAKVKMVQLIGDNSWGESETDYAYLLSEQGLNDIGAVAQGIGPWYPQLVDTEYRPQPWVGDARQLGLAIHPYTFRADALPSDVSSQQFLKLLFNDIQVDGVFTDQTDIVVKYLNRR